MMEILDVKRKKKTHIYDILWRELPTEPEITTKIEVEFPDNKAPIIKSVNDETSVSTEKMLSYSKLIEDALLWRNNKSYSKEEEDE